MAQKPSVLGGQGYQVTVEDVTKIALGQPVTLDSAGAERIKKASPPPKNFVPAECSPSDQAPQAPLLSDAQCRAVIAVKLLQIMNGRSGTRLQVAEYLTHLINHEIVPAVSVRDACDDEQLLNQLADTLYGYGSGHLRGQQGLKPLKELLQGTEAPGLSAAERAVLTGGAAGTAGIGCLVVQAAKKLVSLAAATTALSIEAVGAQVRWARACYCARAPAGTAAPSHHLSNNPRTLSLAHHRCLTAHVRAWSACSQTKSLDAELMEAQGSTAATSVADEMRGLLEGSKRANTLKAAEQDSLPAAFLSAATVGTDTPASHAPNVQLARQGPEQRSFFPTQRLYSCAAPAGMYRSQAMYRVREWTGLLCVWLLCRGWGPCQTRWPLRTQQCVERYRQRPYHPG